jgi:hypothetical protein
MYHTNPLHSMYVISRAQETACIFLLCSLCFHALTQITREMTVRNLHGKAKQRHHAAN